MRKKLSLAAAMLHRPALLLLDEPFEGVDPVSALTVRRVLDRYRHAGGTVVVSSHVMEVLQRFCDRVAIIDRGQVLAAGTLDELAADSTTLEEAFIAIVGEAPTACWTGWTRRRDRAGRRGRSDLGAARPR